MKNFIYTPRLARPDIALTDWSLLKIEEFFSGLKGISVAGVRDVVSRSFSAVLDFYDQIGRRAAGVFNDGVIDRKVSPQLAAGRSLAASYQFASGGPQAESEDAEYRREQGDNRGAVANDKLFVVATTNPEIDPFGPMTKGEKILAAFLAGVATALALFFYVRRIDRRSYHDDNG